MSQIGVFWAPFMVEWREKAVGRRSRTR